MPLSKETKAKFTVKKCFFSIYFWYNQLRNDAFCLETTKSELFVT